MLAVSLTGNRDSSALPYSAACRVNVRPTTTGTPSIERICARNSLCAATDATSCNAMMSAWSSCRTAMTRPGSYRRSRPIPAWIFQVASRRQRAAGGDSAGIERCRRDTRVVAGALPTEHAAEGITNANDPDYDDRQHGQRPRAGLTNRGDGAIDEQHDHDDSGREAEGGAQQVVAPSDVRSAGDDIDHGVRRHRQQPDEQHRHQRSEEHTSA